MMTPEQAKFRTMRSWMPGIGMFWHSGNLAGDPRVIGERLGKVCKTPFAQPAQPDVERRAT